MRFQGCQHCGKEIEEGELYCSECRAETGVRKVKRFWISVSFSRQFFFF